MFAQIIGFILLVPMLSFSQARNPQPPVPCDYPQCDITYERALEFPAIARTYDISVFANASEVVVKNIGGSPGTIRELVLFLRGGQTRYITDAYDTIMSSSGTGIGVNLGRPVFVEYARIKADSWGGAGTYSHFMLQLRERQISR